MKLIRSWVDKVVWLLTFVFFVYMFLMCVGCKTTTTWPPDCFYNCANGWLVKSDNTNSIVELN